MTLPTGRISLSQVNTELSRPATQPISMNDGGLRGLAGRPSGAVNMSDLWGKAAFTISGPGGVSGNALTDGVRPATASATITITATPSDGVTYSWAVISGDATIAPGSNTCTVRTSSRFDVTVQGVVRCTATRGGTTRIHDTEYSLTVSGGEL